MQSLNSTVSPTNSFSSYGEVTVSEPSAVSQVATPLFAKYPPNSAITKLDSTLEIKKLWLYNEWAQECQFSRYVRHFFPNRNDLATNNEHTEVERIQLAFHKVRGEYLLWQAPRELGRWKKVVVPDLKIEWVVKNVEVLYPQTDRFPVIELNGIVLWNDKSKQGSKRYQLYEGNHRISAWLAAQTPMSLPAVLFIGKPAKSSAPSS